MKVAVLTCAICCCSLAIRSQCNVQVTMTPDNIQAQLYHFTANASGTGPLQYQWYENYLGTTGLLPQFSVDFTGATQAVYVHVIVTDSTGCTAFWADTINPGGCFAAFTYNDGEYPFDFEFHTSGLNAFSFWDFGDGTTLSSTANYETHTFPGYGSYTVCHTVYTDSLDSCTQCILLDIDSSDCWAHFDIVFNGGPDSVIINDSYRPGYQYYWTFGDGSSSTSPFPSHTYSNPGGMYQVCLVVSNQFCADTFCRVINLNTCGGPGGDVINVQNPFSLGSPSASAQKYIRVLPGKLEVMQDGWIIISDVSGKILESVTVQSGQALPLPVHNQLFIVTYREVNSGVFHTVKVFTN